MTDDYDVPAEDSDSDDEPTSETTADNQVQQSPITETTSTEVLNSDAAQAANNLIVDGPEEEEPVVASAEQTEAEAERDAAQVERDVTEAEHVREEVIQILEPELPAPSGPRIYIQDGLIIAHDSTTTPHTPPLEYRPPAALAATPLAPVAQQAPEISEQLINLDGDDQDDWEAGEFDFGDEPIDEPWDTWGCLHHFELIQSSKMHQHWLPATNDTQSLRPTKHIDCLKCYKTITITEPIVESKKDDERKDSAVDVSLESAGTQTTNVVEEPDKTVKKRRKNKKQGDIPKIFNCRRCGVVYCIGCKKATMKELNMVLERNTFRV